jgi:GNAT superfamily N-acetyltransferase
VSRAGDQPDRTLVEAVERDFSSAWWLLAEAIDAERHDDGSLRWFHTGAADMHLNPVLSTRLADDDADAVIDGLIAELRARGVPFTWWVMPSASPPDLAARLAARGLVDDGAWPAMAVDASAFVEPPPVEGLEIRRISTAEDFEAYIGVFAPILSPSPAFTDILVRATQRLGFGEDAPEEHFLGLLGGEPVATTSLITAGGMADIYNVTTIEAARGRGIGAAITAAAVRHGAARGFTTATLQASTKGRPVYERLGFEFVCDMSPFREA